MNQTIHIVRGTTESIDIILSNADGGTYSLQSDELLRFGVKASADHTDYVLVKELTSVDINTSGSAYTLTLKPSDTEGMDFTRYCYDVGLQSGDNYYNVIPCSGFIVEPSITKWEISNGS